MYQITSAQNWAYLPGLHDVEVGKGTVCNIQTLVGRGQPDSTVGTEGPGLRTQPGVTLKTTLISRPPHCSALRDAYSPDLHLDAISRVASRIETVVTARKSNLTACSASGEDPLLRGSVVTIIETEEELH